MSLLSGDYDFDAANALEKTLNDAGEKLRTLLTDRASWANQYLAYEPTGPQQGWVGKEYNTWARQFNESQVMMAGYVNQLCGRASDVHNESRRQDTDSKYHLLWYGYLESQPWRGAPVNSAPDNTEGATPQDLYDYSDNATKANDDNFRSFFAQNLASAAAAAPVADMAPSAGENPPASALAGAIVYFLRYQVLELDARVRIVGEAFEFAGHRPAPGQPGLFTFSSQQQLDYALGD